jgi:hypothetical protein
MNMIVQTRPDVTGAPAGPGRPRAGPRSWLAAMAVGLVLTVAACSGDDAAGSDGAGSASGAGQSRPTAVNTEAALLAFAQCIREHGVEIPDPTVDADGNVLIQPPAGAVSDPALRERFGEARTACADHLEGVTQGFTNEDRAQLQDQLVAVAQCMRGKGIDVPDPDLSQLGQGSQEPGGGGGLFGDSIDRNDPAVQAALRECQTEVFGPGGGPGPFGGGGN